MSKRALQVRGLVRILRRRSGSPYHRQAALPSVREERFADEPFGDERFSVGPSPTPRWGTTRPPDPLSRWGQAPHPAGGLHVPQTPPEDRLDVGREPARGELLTDAREERFPLAQHLG